MQSEFKQNPWMFVASVALFTTSGMNTNTHLLAYGVPLIGWFGYFSHLVALLMVARFVLGWRRP
jgi:hypothetical protein